MKIILMIIMFTVVSFGQVVDSLSIKKDKPDYSRKELFIIKQERNEIPGWNNNKAKSNYSDIDKEIDRYVERLRNKFKDIPFILRVKVNKHYLSKVFLTGDTLHGFLKHNYTGEILEVVKPSEKISRGEEINFSKMGIAYGHYEKIEEGKEYLVFLGKFEDKNGIKVHSLRTLGDFAFCGFPIGDKSCSYAAYLIEDNYLIDTENCFGYGNRVEWQKFKEFFTKEYLFKPLQPVR